MEVKVSVVIQSNLDDAMIEMSSNPTLAHERLSFIKYLIRHYPDTQTKITVDEDYSKFKKYSIWVVDYINDLTNELESKN
jgi:hypothetical protein